MKHTLQKHT